MNQRLQLPAWLLAVAIFAQLLMVILSAHLIWKQAHQPKVWTLDSTTYYRYLAGQGQLNLKLYNQQHSHEERLRRLDKSRQARHRHIDSLSGDALQLEIDRQYNGGRQPTRSGAPGPGQAGLPGGPAQTNPTNGSGRSAGAERSGGPDHAARRGQVSGYPTLAATAGDYPAGADDQPAQSTAAAGAERWSDRPGPGRRLPEAVARSQVGELDNARGRPVVYSRQVQTDLNYWRLIREQGFMYPDVAFAISAVETGYWSPSAAIMKQNNLFAFKANSRRKYTGLKGGYCIYVSRQTCLADYRAYEQQVIAKYNLHSRAAYLTHICRRFCPNPHYRGKLDLALQKLSQLKPLA